MTLIGKTITRIITDDTMGVVLTTMEGDNFALIPDHMDAPLPDITGMHCIIGNPITEAGFVSSASTHDDGIHSAVFFNIKTTAGSGHVEYFYYTARHEELRVMLCRLEDEYED